MKTQIFLVLLCALCLLAGLSAFSAHVLWSSPAFQADFSYGFSGRDVPKEILDEESPMPNPLFGAFVEWGRIIILAFFLALVWLFSYPVLSREGERQRFLRYRSRTLWIIIGFLVLLTSVLIVWYHGWEGPRRLCHQPKYWKQLELKRNAWQGYEKLLAKNTIEEYAKKMNEEGTPEYRSVYVMPYLMYLPYSLVIYVFILIPFLVRAYAGARGDFATTREDVHQLWQESSNAGTRSDIDRIVPLVQRARLRLSETLDRYSWLVLYIVVIGVYEAFLGYKTLAPLALFFIAIAFFSLLSGFVFVLPSVLDYRNAVVEIRLRLADIATRAITEDERTATATLDDSLARCGLGSILLSGGGVTLAIKVLSTIGALVGAILKVHGEFG